MYILAEGAQRLIVPYLQQRLITESSKDLGVNQPAPVIHDRTALQQPRYIEKTFLFRA
jgi:hypothetical protein